MPHIQQKDLSIYLNLSEVQVEYNKSAYYDYDYPFGGLLEFLHTEYPKGVVFDCSDDLLDSKQASARIQWVDKFMFSEEYEDCYGNDKDLLHNGFNAGVEWLKNIKNQPHQDKL